MPSRRREEASSPDPMSALLVAIRGELSQGDAGRRAGAYLERGTLTQAKVSRAESGRIPLSPDEADAFARGCGASSEQRRRLVRLARDFAAGQVTDRTILVRNPHLLQQRIGRLERDSTLIRGWQPEVVVGMLQTPAWTKAAFGDPGDAWWKAREDRLALLGDDTRSWHFLMSEAVLLWNLGAAVMLEQINYLIELTQRPQLQLGVVPLATEKPLPAPSAFHLFGHRVAVVATPSGTAFITAPADITAYEATFDGLDQLAVYDADAQALLSELAQRYDAR